MIRSYIVGNVIYPNGLRKSPFTQRPQTPIPGEITDAILCEDGSIMLNEDGSYMQLETALPTSVEFKKEKK